MNFNNKIIANIQYHIIQHIKLFELAKTYMFKSAGPYLHIRSRGGLGWIRVKDTDKGLTPGYIRDPCATRN